MSTISADTKIATLLKENPAALDAIISISPKFNKLRNPLLRKLMASRTSISMASKVGGCTVNDFFNKLEPLGFTIDRNEKVNETVVQKQTPAFLQKISEADIVELDVRAEIETGKDRLT